MTTPKNGENSGGNSGALVRQTHGGALLRGGVRGNRGGTGRPRNEIVAALRHALAERIPVLVAIIDDPVSTHAERIRALEVLARYGVGSASREEDREEQRKVQIVVVRRDAPPALPTSRPAEPPDRG